MLNNLSTESLARASAARPKRVVIAWLILLVAAMGLVGTLFNSAVTTEFVFLKDVEPQRGETLLEERLRGPVGIRDVVVVRSAESDVDSDSYRSFVNGLTREIVALGPDIVSSATNYYETGEEGLVSPNRRSTILPIVTAGDLLEAESNVRAVHAILDGIDAGSGFETYITGEATFSNDFTVGAQEDIEKGEAFGVPIALVILATVFGALAAAILPILLAVGSIVIAIGLAAIVGQGFEIHLFVQNIITMIGLAVGIDYSLFIVSRFREERARGLPKADAIAVAGATASRAVFFSGLTVVLALVGLLIVPNGVFVSMGIGAILVVTVAVIASLTLLPAVLSVMGDGVNRLRVPLLNRGSRRSSNGEDGVWDKIVHVVMRRPVVSLVLGAALLIAAATPYLSINIGTSGVSTFPEDFKAKAGFEVLQEEFGFGLDAPAEVVIDGAIEAEPVAAAIQNLRGRLANDAGFGSPTLEINEAGDLALLSVPMIGDPTAEDTLASLVRLRSQYIADAFRGVPADVFVAGATAEEVDFNDIAARYLPIVVGIVLALSFVLLTVVFRSIVIPITAIIMNLLSVGAGYGILVLVWQHGIGNELFGFPQVDVIQAWLPIMMFAILFGLSMDYQVFLISRIKERYDQTGNNPEAVAYGLRSTAGLITGAALIMVAVFSGFAAGDLVPPAQFGFGMAVAILVDATIVRSVLVPSTMKLLGDRNWYLPNALRWLPNVSVEGGRVAEPVPVRVND